MLGDLCIVDFRPDVAFLDIGLPGMSGYELAAQMRRDPRLRGVVLVAVTGWGQAEDRQKSKEAGFDVTSPSLLIRARSSRSSSTEPAPPKPSAGQLEVSA